MVRCQACLFCGGDSSAPDHATVCDGRQGALEAALAAVPDFDGETYDPVRDHDRLGRQLLRVYTLMADGQWRTPEECEAALPGERWASINARLRDLRKAKFGGYRVVRESLGGGLFRYALCRCTTLVCPHTARVTVPPEPDPEWE